MIPSNQSIDQLYHLQDSQNQFIIQSNSYNLHYDLSEYSGVIRGQWHKDGGKLQSICYGSGIAISKRIVLTCAHSIYLQKKNRVCDSVTFIPKHTSGKIEGNKKIYHSTKHEFIKLQSIKLGSTFTKNPIPQDIALIYLSQDLDYQAYPDVGLDHQKEIELKSQLFLSGYPSMQYYAIANLNQINFQRMSLRGNLLEIRQNTIYHNLPTMTGHSGSGIFAYSIQKQKETIIGIHTHKGRTRNSGVYLSNLILKRLVRYEIQLVLHHEQYIAEINFPRRIREEVFNELKESDRQILKNRCKNYNEIWINSFKYKKDQQYDDSDNNSDISLDYMKDYCLEDIDIEEEDMQISVIELRQQQLQNKIKSENYFKRDEQIGNILKDIQYLRLQNKKMQIQLNMDYNLQLQYQILRAHNMCLRLLKQIKQQKIRQYKKVIEQKQKQVLMSYRQLSNKLDVILLDLYDRQKLKITFSKFISVSDHLDYIIANTQDDILSQIQCNFIDNSNIYDQQKQILGMNFDVFQLNKTINQLEQKQQINSTYWI